MPTTAPTTTAPPAPLRLGVLGCAGIANGFVRDVASSQHLQVVAVASRQADKAQRFAATHHIPLALDSYEALLAHPGVEAVYIPLPNSLHAEWAIKAAQAGKHVLCEKPLALSRREAQAMFAAARAHGVKLLEAYPYSFQPQVLAGLAQLQAGAIGEVRGVQAYFGFTLNNPAQNIRTNPDLGGGALLDAGSYPLSLVRLAMACAPVRVQAHARWDASGVDIATTATLFYADGRCAQIHCAMDAANHRHATIMGSAGTIETEYLNHTSDSAGSDPRGYLPSQWRVRRGTANTVAFEDLPASATGSGFLFEAEAFAQWVRGDWDLSGREAVSLDTAATLEALALSARNGRVVDVAEVL
jgi:predicted dehydrogenase